MDHTALTEGSSGAGIMVSLMLDGALSRTLAVRGGEAPEGLHCTLAYLGQTESYTREALLRMAGAAYLYACNRGIQGRRSNLQGFGGNFTEPTMGPPLTGVISGVGRFHGTDGMDVAYLSVDMPELPEFRQGLVEALEAAVPGCVYRTHGYTPHVTLKYLDAGAAMPYTETAHIPLVFEGITLSIGGNDQLYRFNPNTSQMSSVRRFVTHALAPPSGWRYPMNR